jgi:hypothetical protein
MVQLIDTFAPSRQALSEMGKSFGQARENDIAEQRNLESLKTQKIQGEAAQMTLDKLKKRRDDDTELQSILDQTPDAERDKAAFTFFKGRDRERAAEIGQQIMQKGTAILKFDPEGGVKYLNDKLGTDFKYTGKQGDLIKVDTGQAINLVDPNTGKAVSTFPKTEEVKPQSKRAKLQADVKAGLITQEQADAELKGEKRTKTAEMKNYEFAKNQGFEGSMLDFQAHGKDPEGKTNAIKEFEYGIKNPEFVVAQKAKENAKSTKDAEKADFKDVSSLRKEFLSQSAEYQKVRDSYTRVIGSTKEPSPAGDLSLIFNYMKMLDPGSVVRESEFATAASSGSYGQRMQASVQKVLSGERLAPAMRKDFVEKASVLLEGMQNQHKKRVKSYKNIAEKNGFPVEEVIVDITAPTGTVPNFDLGKTQQDGKIKFMGFE